MTNEKLGMVISDYNADITHLMGKIAEEHAEFLGAKVAKLIRVPGAFDMPLAVRKLVEKKDIDGVVCLGAVIEGDTKHDEIVAHNAARKITDLSVQSGKPVALGISGPGMTRADGIKRIESYAKRSVETAVKMIRRLK
ncbi:MAG: 6,7-dimethyl-8-ribityllumazine synthase [Nanoarchaeota archaeon]|nr:6,7-dimethyl-8-ribityllumazine synthase [Nanoarchaeota archaeon]MBU1004191.1 6,7-dimethyl-8-ribityllumazine synthase [Nanoarchaeota archaeon]MBU1945357.1 6,7-dimethyl-8-ribityllumazine synthase [Nanoarchaeota archaeon]